VPFSCKLGTLTSWNSMGHSRPVTGLLYFTHFCLRLSRPQDHSAAGIEPTTLWFVAQCLNQLRHSVPPSLLSFRKPLDLHRHRMTYGREKASLLLTNYLKSSPITSYSEEQATVRPRQLYNFRSLGSLQSLIFISGITSSVALLIVDSV
jgi:hypothetical protein